MLCGFPNATEEEELSDQRRHLLEEASPTSALNYSCSSSDLQVGAARKSYTLTLLSEWWIKDLRLP